MPFHGMMAGQKKTTYFTLDWVINSKNTQNHNMDIAFPSMIYLIASF